MFLQVYSPNYVAPPAKCCSDEMDMDLRYLQIQFFYDLISLHSLFLSNDK
jgi:hypothetical protein